MSQTLQTVPPSYLYGEYADDDDLQAFVASYNAYAQQYLNSFNQLNLPVYTSAGITGALLDWVGAGIYGYPRPSLPGTPLSIIGPYNTYAYDANLPLNTEKVTTATSYATTDDIYKRCLTWHFYKGDGKTCTIPWLKRRLMRFLLGTNGTAPNIDSTTPISLTFGSGEIFVTITRTATSTFSDAIADALQSGILSGALETPFQYAFNVTVVG